MGVEETKLFSLGNDLVESGLNMLHWLDDDHFYLFDDAIEDGVVVYTIEITVDCVEQMNFLNDFILLFL